MNNKKTHAGSPLFVAIVAAIWYGLLLNTAVYAITPSDGQKAAVPQRQQESDSTESFQSLTYVVQKTLQQNPNILESQAREREARANLRVAQGGFLPQVGVQAANGRGSYNDEYRSEIIKTTNETEAGINLVQPIFSGLTTKNTVSQRRFEFRASSYNKVYTEEQLALQAVNAYLEMLRLRKLQQLALDNTKTHEIILRKVTILFKGGGGQKGDVDLADGRLAQSKNTLELVNKSLQNAQAFFIKVVGEEPQKLKDPQLPVLSQDMLDLTTSKILAYQHNPALLSYQEGVKAAKAQVAVAKGKLSPTLNLQLSANDNNNTYGNDYHNKDVRGMAVLGYNLYNGGSDVAAIDAATQNLSATLQKRDTVQREVTNNLVSALNTLNADKIRLKDLQRHVQSSVQVLDSYRKQFTLGRRTLLDVLNIEDELFNAKADLLNGEYALCNDTYALLAAIGYLAAEFRWSARND